MDYKKLSDEELLSEHKKVKTNDLINATLIGTFVGIACYSTIKHGAGFFTFFPLFFVFIFLKRKKDNKELENELKSRNLK
ncbi:hypothetical protein [Pedobacter insulae]|uniref:FUSC family protein n=1 Tax=Pedobacter insulae TaxID=414048 RepID=A0A1I2Y5N4_9SPHI|nr:hypothetical protein [Pedobacter insulae]SFH20669.1 hypothetical protein SAMN04489864_106225 [Pedobacter insulae]